MELIIKILVEIIFVFINIFIAKLQAKQWLNSQKNLPFWKIKHGWWSFLYLGLVMIPIFILQKDNFLWYNKINWVLFFSLLILRKPIFDCFYNYFRNYNIFFVSKHLYKNEASSSSIIDDLHWKIFKNKAEIYQPIYLSIVILLNFFI